MGHWYCSSARQQSVCTQCKQERLRQRDFEPQILKLVCEKSHLVPETWGMREEDWEKTVKVCEGRFGWKRDRTRRRR